MHRFLSRFSRPAVSSANLVDEIGRGIGDLLHAEGAPPRAVVVAVNPSLLRARAGVEDALRVRFPGLALRVDAAHVSAFHVRAAADPRPGFVVLRSGRRFRLSEQGISFLPFPDPRVQHLVVPGAGSGSCLFWGAAVETWLLLGAGRVRRVDGTCADSGEPTAVRSGDNILIGATPILFLED